MNQVLTPQDWIKISAYLDGQLSQVERDDVEQLCTSNPTWQAGLSALEHTRTLLRSAPKRGAPRNFTISEKIANSIRKPARGILTLRWVNVFSSAVAAVLLIFGFVMRPAPSFMTAAPAPEAALMMERSADAALEPTLPPIIIWGMPGTVPQGYAKAYDPVYGMGGMGGGGGGGGGDGGYVPAPAPAALAPEMTTESADLPPASEPVSPEEAPALTAEQAEPLELPASGPILGLNAEAPAEVALEAEQTLRESSPEDGFTRQPLIIAGLILAIAAVITGIFAWRKPTP